MKDAVAALGAAEVALTDHHTVGLEVTRHGRPRGIVDEVHLPGDLPRLDSVAELDQRLEQSRLRCGNRIPPITAEIAWAGAPQAVVKDTTFLPGADWFTNSAVLDSERGFLYFKTSPDGIGRIRTSGMVEDLRVPATELGIDLNSIKAIDSRGDLYVTHGITEQSFRKIDGHTFQVVASASFSSEVQLATVSAYTLTGRIDFVLALGFLSAPARIFFADDLSVFWQGQSVSSRPGGLVGGLCDFGACEAGFAAYPSIVLGIRPPRSASSMCGSSCRSWLIRSPARRRL